MKLPNDERQLKHKLDLDNLSYDRRAKKNKLVAILSTARDRQASNAAGAGEAEDALVPTAEQPPVDQQQRRARFEPEIDPDLDLPPHNEDEEDTPEYEQTPGPNINSFLPRNDSEDINSFLPRNDSEGPVQADSETGASAPTFNGIAVPDELTEDAGRPDSDEEDDGQLEDEEEEEDGEGGRQGVEARLQRWREAEAELREAALRTPIYSADKIAKRKEQGLSIEPALTVPPSEWTTKLIPSRFPSDLWLAWRFAQLKFQPIKLSNGKKRRAEGDNGYTALMHRAMKLARLSGYYCLVYVGRTHVKTGASKNHDRLWFSPKFSNVQANTIKAFILSLVNGQRQKEQEAREHDLSVWKAEQTAKLEAERKAKQLAEKRAGELEQERADQRTAVQRWKDEHPGQAMPLEVVEQLLTLQVG